MVKLQDGPCQGSYMVRRAPVYLRAVKDTLTGDTDLLDQQDDTPSDLEAVYVYKLQEGTLGTVHLYGRDKKGKRLRGWYALGEYRHLPDVRGEDLRDTSAWQDWVKKQ